MSEYGAFKLDNGTQISYKIMESGCWHFIGGANKGYGHVKYKQRTYRANRFVYCLAHRIELSDTIVVRHTCDNSICINPKHLIEGTTQNNVDDKIARGRARYAKGTSHGNASLTEADVLAIRKAKGTLKAIGSQYGISFQQVSAIKLRKKWSHI